MPLPFFGLFRAYALWLLGDKQGFKFRISMIGSFLPILIGLVVPFIATQEFVFGAGAIILTVYHQLAWMRFFDEDPSLIERSKPSAGNQ